MTLPLRNVWRHLSNGENMCGQKQSLDENPKVKKPEEGEIFDWSEVRVSNINMVAHFICVLFSAFVIYTAQPGTSLFSWHPTLLSLAYMFLMAESIMIFSPESSLLQKASRATKVKWHWIMMVSALVCASAGVGAIWYNKERAGKAHATSNHGKLGYLIVLYTASQCCAGVLLLYPKVVSKSIKLSQLKSLHAMSGSLLYVLVSAGLVSGMNSTWFTSQVTGTSWYACLACPIILLAVVVNQVAASVLGKSAPKK